MVLGIVEGLLMSIRIIRIRPDSFLIFMWSPRHGEFNAIAVQKKIITFYIDLISSRKLTTTDIFVTMEIEQMQFRFNENPLSRLAQTGC